MKICLVKKIEKNRHFLSLKTRPSSFNIKSIEIALQLNTFNYIEIISLQLKRKITFFFDEKLVKFIYLLMNVCKDELIT